MLSEAGVPDADFDAQEMLARVLGEDRLNMRIDSGRELDDSDVSHYEALIARRAAREPMQYILGDTCFMGLDLHVAPGVLIPRHDTEILCEEAIRRLGITGRCVLDIGTGSGALAIAIALFAVRAQVTAVDVSDDALSIAAQNARRLGAMVRFKPLITLSDDGHVELVGKGIGMHRATDAVIRLVEGCEIDRSFPVIPIYSHTPENCLAFVRKLNAAGIACEEDGIMPIGATISTHIGPGAFGLVFVEKA